MQTIYLVLGNTGEYSDWAQWPVATYTEREQADLHAAKANAYAKMVEEIPWGDDTWDGSREYQGGKERQAACKANPYDPGAELMNGGEYQVVEVPPPRQLDEYLESRKS